MYAYFGFESSTFAIQETKNPSKNVPLSLILSLCIITVLYCGASLSLVLMQPFNKIDMHSSFPTAFIHIEWAHVITSIGPVLSLTGALLISIYSLERIIFAMAKDGLFFKFFSKLHPRTQVPYFATLFSFVITLLLVVLVDIKALNGYVDISGFLTYSIVGTGLLIVRYCVIDEEDDNDDDDAHRDQNNYDETCLNECCPPTSDASTVTSRLMTDSMYADDENNLLTDSVPPERLTVPSAAAAIARDNRRRCKFFQNRHVALSLIILIFMANIIFSFLINKLFGDAQQQTQTKLYLIAVGFNVLAALFLRMFRQANKQTSSISFRVSWTIFFSNN
jgi:hypothetical protein